MIMEKWFIGLGGLYVVGILVGAIGYLTHLAWCVKALISTAIVGDLLLKSLVLGIGGAIVFPLGAIHGIIIWFNGWTFL